jgi:hypothetical protein
MQSKASLNSSATMTFTVCSPSRKSRASGFIPDRPRIDAGQLDPVGLVERHGEARRVHEILDRLKPVTGGRERHVDLGEDSARPIGVMDAAHLGAAQFRDLRILLDADRLGGDNVAAVAREPTRPCWFVTWRSSPL